MNPLQHQVLDCKYFSEILDQKSIKYSTLTIKEDIQAIDITKYTYRSPNTGNWVYVLELSRPYCADGYTSDVWFFSANFSEADAWVFVMGQDKFPKIQEKKDSTELLAEMASYFEEEN